LAIYLDAINKAIDLSRNDVRSQAATEFSTASVVDRLITCLDQLRDTLPNTTLSFDERFGLAGSR
jgi:hypothetical protein